MNIKKCSQAQTVSLRERLTLTLALYLMPSSWLSLNTQNSEQSHLIQTHPRGPEDSAELWVRPREIKADPRACVSDGRITLLRLRRLPKAIILSDTLTSWFPMKIWSGLTWSVSDSVHHSGFFLLVFSLGITEESSLTHPLVVPIPLTFFPPLNTKGENLKVVWSFYEAQHFIFHCNWRKKPSDSLLLCSEEEGKW